MKISKVIETLCVAIVGGLVVVTYNYFSTEKHTSTKYVTSEKIPVYQTDYQLSMGVEANFQMAVKKTINSVVHVKTAYQPDKYEKFIYGFFSGNDNVNQEPILGFGSGVIVSDKGYIVTNNHVIEKSEFIEVVLNDKRSFKAQLIGTDPTTDVALLKIDGADLSAIEYGNSETMQIGDWALAIGNPFNLTSTVTAGIISAKARNINTMNDNLAIESFIQTDAAVNPGNSGGALVNIDGQLIGINTAIASRTGYYSGYSFAIPANVVRKIVSDIIEFGSVQRAFLGADVTDIDADMAETLSLDKIEGVVVTSVAASGAAKDAGIKSNDIILKINDIAINKVTEMQEQISQFRPGNSIKLTIKRNGEIMVIDLTLRNKVGSTGIIDTDVFEKLGAKFSEINETEKKKLGIDYGVKIAELSAGKLMKSGVNAGYIILKINRQEVKTIDDVQKIISNSTGGVILEGIYQNGESAYYAFGIK